eukprot:2183116-Pleurochrysis_carterae.AAC.1
MPRQKAHADIVNRLCERATSQGASWKTLKRVRAAHFLEPEERSEDSAGAARQRCVSESNGASRVACAAGRRREKWDRARELCKTRGRENTRTQNLTKREVRSESNRSSQVDRIAYAWRG